MTSNTSEALKALDLVEQSGDILVKYGLAPHAWDEAGREALEAAISEIIVLTRTPSPQANVTGGDIEPRSRMQLSPGYLNSFETVISALKSGGEQAQDAGHIAHGACLLHAAAELEAVLAERIAPQEAPPIEQTPAEAFAKWLDAGPKLAKAAGCYVGIEVSAALAAEGSAE